MEYLIIKANLPPLQTLYKLGLGLYLVNLKALGGGAYSLSSLSF